MYVCTVCICVFVLEKKMLNCSHPQAKLSLVALSLCLCHVFASIDLKQYIFIWGSWCFIFSPQLWGWGYQVTGCTPVPLVMCLFFFFLLCRFCIIKLDNCTVLMTSSNILSISVTKSNLDIQCVHEWHTSMLFCCMRAWTSVIIIFYLHVFVLET